MFSGNSLLRLASVQSFSHCVFCVIIMILESIQVSNFVVANGKLIENVHSKKKKKKIKKQMRQFD